VKESAARGKAVFEELKKLETAFLPQLDVDDDP
jgi:hypothetical protein